MHVERQHVWYLIAAVILIALVVVNTSGMQATGSGAPSYDMDDGYSVRSMRAGLAVADGADYAYDEESAIATTAANVEQKVIKTADLELEVHSAAESTSAIVDIATARGGFAGSSSVNEDAFGNKRGYVSIRVPVADFEAVLTDVKALADKVVSESSNGQDVTEEYTDVEARLNAAKAQEAQYLVILQSAETVGEILAVQEHLADVRAEVESLQGRINYLQNRTSMSTISVSMLETSRITIPAEKFVLSDEIRDAARMLILVFQKLVIALIWIVIVGGPVAIISYSIYRIIRYFRRPRSRK